MAKKDENNFNGNSSSIEPRRFDGNLEKNFNDYHLKENQWTYARNAITNSNIGDLGRLGNEPANLECISVPTDYSIIGVVHIEKDIYVVFSTNNVSSEIGYFQRDTCTYTKIVNDNCLNFSTKHLIYGVSRETSECNHIVYWADGNNPDRFINVGDIRQAPFTAPWPTIPWVCEDVNSDPDCFNCQPIGPPYVLDCNKIRLAPLMEPLCFRVEKSANGGNLLNGSYMVVGAYTIKGEKMTDYFPPSNQQPIFDHSGSGGSITITIENADTTYFDEFELVIISIIGQQTVARKLGIYSTRQGIITIDIIDTSLPAVPIEQIPIRTPVYDKSDAMFTVNDYLLRVGPTTKLDFNYQPLANQIVTKWQSIEYRANYYRNGGNKTGYMRDEVYAFFIRWVYDTGDRSASYHIPGRPYLLTPYTIPGDSTQYFEETSLAPINTDNIEVLKNGIACPPKIWEVYNTAVTTGFNLNIPIDADDCDINGQGTVIEEGLMGYWESTERYPDNKEEIWNSNLSSPPPGYSATDADSYNLCGKPIRHHKFPDNDHSLGSTIFDTTASDLTAPRRQKIRIMGVKFENIKRPLIDPKDPTKGLVPGIKGFEILRGSRQGNRTIIAKGIINNMVEYEIPRLVQNSDVINNNLLTTEKALFQNYPYNDLGGDEFLSTRRTRWKGTGTPTQADACEIGYYQENSVNWDTSANEGEYEFKVEQYKRNYFSFHSPETNFAKPFLGARELKVYQELDGMARMYYQFPSGHPQHKMMKDIAWLLAAIAGLGTAIPAAFGKIVREYTPPPTPSEPIALNGIGLNLLLASFGISPQYLWDFTSTAGVNTLNVEDGGIASVSPVLSVLFQFVGNIPTFSYYWAEGADATWRLIKNSVAYQQYALQQYSHCFYDNSVSASSGQPNSHNPRATGQRRRFIENASYVDDQMQTFENNIKINNLYRNNYVALKVNADLAPPVKEDKSRYKTSLKYLSEELYTVSGTITEQDKQNVYKNPELGFFRPSSTYYAAIKQRLYNQYGQLDNIKQLPISCVIENCAELVELENLVTNSYFTNDLSSWSVSPPNYWYQLGQKAISIGNPVITNDLYQSVNLIPGEKYTLKIKILQLDIRAKLGIRFNQNQSSNTLEFIEAGSYNQNIIAQAGDNVISIREQFANQSDACNINLMIVFDSSSSVDDLNHQRDLAIGIVQNFDAQISSGLMYIGFYDVDDSNFTPNPISYVIQWPNANSVVNFINNINFGGTGASDIGGALCNIASIFNNTVGRQNAARKIIMMSDFLQTIGFTCGNPAVNGNLGPSQYECSSFDFYPAVTNKIIELAVKLKQFQNTDLIAVQYGSSCLQTFMNLYVVLMTGNISNVFSSDDLPNSIAASISNTLCELNPTIIDDIELIRLGCPDELTGSSGTLFRGDVYINRYTEKNTFFYFYDWLFKQPDGSYFNYQKYNMLPYPTYWINTEEFDVMQGASSLSALLTQLPNTLTSDIGNLGNDIFDEVQDYITIDDPINITVNFNATLNLFQNITTPSDYHVLDRPNFAWTFGGQINPFGLLGNDIASILGCGPGLIIKYGYFYLFNSGVRDFYVESEFNTALRDWDDDPARRHYDHKSYSSLSDMFKTDIIKSGNFYKYDTSLSISKNWFSYTEWGNLQQRSYDPTLAETCFQYRPDRIIYSLEAQYESVRDNWRIFLPNNYKDFLSKVKSVKQINKSGSIILFEADSPLMFQGLDQLQTDLGTKLTIGDGGLFSQPMQNIVNSERSYEYASCQNRLSVINTPAGVFWINVNQGKIFQLDKGLKEVSMGNVKWWLAQYLPYQLTKYFPKYQYQDNPVHGIGCQVIYDNTNNIVYFSKKDYKPRLENGVPIVSYDVENDLFTITQGGLILEVPLGDPRYFDDASWTMSYDIKTESWVSFHDWHPDLTISSKNTFMTTKDNKIWIHNLRCDKYSNYYDQDYPFEVEYTVNTMQTVNTLRSIEYQLEVYKYKFDNCYDRFHDLDFNFDEAVIYNTEQCSGLLKLNLTPKNNAPAIVTYPQVTQVGVGTSGQIDILYSKEENKYRFNQFWDTTYDRGEFFNPLIPGFAERTIWNTGPDGYKRNLNNFNLNYSKSPLQRKKFRHYTTSVLLRRKVSGDRKMLVSITNNKNLLSPR